MTPTGRSPAAERLLELALDAAAAGLGLGGLLLTLTGRPLSGRVLLLVVVVLVAVRLVPRLSSSSSPGQTRLGQQLVARALLAGAAGATLAAGTSTAGTIAALLATALLVGCLAAEPFLARAVRFSVPVTSGLPGLPPPPRAPNLGPAAVAAGLLAAGAGLLVSALGLPAGWWLACVLLATVPVVVLAVTARAKVLYARRRRDLLPDAVARFAPEFVVYTSRPDDASYQILMWLPYLQRAGLRFLVVTRNAVPAAALAARTDVPVVEARTMTELEGLVVPSLKAAFYVNASSGNGALVRYQHLTHIYLGHGDSDKPPSYNPTHAMYDQVFAAGPAATRRYAAHGVKIPAEKFRIVGRPQVEDVAQVDRVIAEVAAPVVLYAPTWRGHVEETMLYSLPDGERIVSALLERGATVVFRPHPFSYDFPDDAAVIRRIHALLAADARRTGRGHLWGAAAETERGILDCINDSDAMVSDVSSVVSDYLFSGKPFAMIAVPALPEAFVEEFPVAAASYVVRGDLADLGEQLAAMLGPDPLRAQRLALRADYLGDFPADGYADAFVSAVQHVTQQPRADQDTDQEVEDQAEAGGNGPVGFAPDGTEAVDPEPGGNEPAGAGAEHADPEDTPTAAGGLSRYRRLLQNVGLSLLGTTLALLALAATLVLDVGWLPAVLAVAALVLEYLAAEGRTRGRRSVRLLATGQVTRALLLVALAVVVGEDLTWATAAGLLLLAVALAGERSITSAWGPFGLVAVNLPAAVRPVRELVPREWLPRLSLVVPLGFVLLGPLAAAAEPTADWPDFVFLLVCAVVFVVFLGAVERALRRAVGAIRGETRLREALTELEPEFAVYFASTVGAGYQVGMWLPYFARIGRPFVILTRTVPMLRQIARLCEEQGITVPIVHRPTLRSLEDAIVPSMTSAFYVNNAVRNTHFIERRELTHVWLNHGDSEKPACYNPVHAIYDLIFAAGQAGIDRYARHGVHIPRDKFQIVGRPQVERIEPARGPVAERQPPTVLYAPTWQGPYADTRVFSLPLGRDIVAALLRRGVRVVFRAHPFNYRYGSCRDMIAEIGAMLDADREQTGREHLWGAAAERELSVEDCFNLSDAMISDVSAVVSDYLRSDKPFAMVAVGRTPEQLVADAPAAQAAYVLREDLSNLEQMLDDLLGADPLVSTRRQTRIYYLGDFPPDSYADGFLDAARRVIDAGHALPAVTQVPEPA